MLRGNIAAPSLKILWKNLNSVKCYDKSNKNVFTLSQWENFRWGLIYFDQFSIQEQKLVYLNSLSQVQVRINKAIQKTVLMLDFCVCFLLES